MANYQSRDFNYTNPLPTYDFSIIGKALQYKQGLADTNIAKIQAEIDQYSSIDLARDVDKEYFGQKLNSLVSNINNIQGADFSAQSTASIISGNIRNAIDDKVITAAASTKSLRKLQSDIETVKTKQPERYNQLNEAFSMRGAQAWLANPNVGASYRGGTYDAYEDVNATQLKVLKDFKDVRGEEEITVPILNPDGSRSGQMKTTKINGLTSEEIMAYMPNILPQSSRKQLEINGWGKYQGQGGLQVAQENLTEYAKQKNAQFDKQINIASLGEEQSGQNVKQKEEYTRQKQAILQQQKDFNENTSRINVNDTASIGGFLESSQWLNNFSQMAGARTSTSYDEDKLYFSMANLNLAQTREARLQESENLDSYKKKLEIQKLEGELSPAGGEIALSPVLGDIPSELNVVKDVQASIATLNGQFGQMAQQVAQGATEAEKTLFAEKYIQESNGNPLDPVAYRKAFETVFKDSHPQEYSQMLQVYNESKMKSRGLVKAEDEALVEEVTAKRDLYYQRLRSYAAVNPTVAKYLSDSNLKREDLSSANPQKTAEVGRMLMNLDAGLLQNADPVTRNLNRLGNIFGNSELNIGENIQNRKAEILKDKGYSGFTTASSANLLSEQDRVRVKNSLSQDGGYDFDEKSPMSIRKNTDGSFLVTQNTEGKKDGSYFGSTVREAVVAKGSTLYSWLNSKVGIEAQRNVRLNSDTPAREPGKVAYMDGTSQRTLADATAFILEQTKGNVLPVSGANPANYITSESTYSTYTRSALGKTIPAEKLKTLTALMAQNSEKFQVRAEVKKGEWSTSVRYKSPVPLELFSGTAGTADNNSDIQLYVEQYPQIMVGESIYNYLIQDPSRIDNLLQQLSR